MGDFAMKGGYLMDGRHCFEIVESEYSILVPAFCFRVEGIGDWVEDIGFGWYLWLSNNGFMTVHARRRAGIGYGMETC